MKTDGKFCVNCGCKNNLTIDHIIPLSRGGGNHKKNKQSLCGLCNQIKGDKDAMILKIPSVKKIIKKWKEQYNPQRVYHSAGGYNQFLYNKKINTKQYLDEFEYLDVPQYGVALDLFKFTSVITVFAEKNICQSCLELR